MFVMYWLCNIRLVYAINKLKVNIYISTFVLNGVFILYHSGIVNLHITGYAACGQILFGGNDIYIVNI
jgi:hypothetical protein